MKGRVCHLQTISSVMSGLRGGLIFWSSDLKHDAQKNVHVHIILCISGFSPSIRTLPLELILRK